MLLILGICWELWKKKVIGFSVWNATDELIVGPWRDHYLTCTCISTSIVKVHCSNNTQYTCITMMWEGGEMRVGSGGEIVW